MSGDILLSDIGIVPPTPWSIRGVVGGTTVIWGEPGSKKTFTAIGMAVCVAAGRSWFGSQVKQGPVLYILGEGGLDLFRRRAQEAVRYHGADINIPLFVRGEPLDLSTPRKAEQYYDSWDSICPSLIVVDTLSRCFPGDENDQGAMQGFVAALDITRARYKCNVIVIHHESKAGDLRGSTVLNGALDVSLHLEDKRDGIIITPKKLRDLDVESFMYNELHCAKIWIKDDNDQYLLDEYGDRVSTLVIQDTPAHGQKVENALFAFEELKSERGKYDLVGYQEWLEKFIEKGYGSAATFKRALAVIIADESRGIVAVRRGRYDHITNQNPFKPVGSPGKNYADPELEDEEV